MKNTIILATLEAASKLIDKRSAALAKELAKLRERQMSIKARIHELDPDREYKEKLEVDEFWSRFI